MKCTSCEGGTFQTGIGSSSCTACGSGTYATGLGSLTCSRYPRIDCFNKTYGTSVIGCDGVCGSGKVIGGCNHKCGSVKVLGCDGVCGSCKVRGYDRRCNSKKTVGCDGVCGSRTVIRCDGVCVPQNDAPVTCSTSPLPTTPAAPVLPPRPNFTASQDTEFTRPRPPLPGTNRSYSASVTANTTGGLVSLDYNATVSNTTVVLDGLEEVLWVECSEQNDSVRLRLWLSPSADLGALSDRLHYGSVVHGGPEWGCLNQSAPFYLQTLVLESAVAAAPYGRIDLLAMPVSPFFAFDSLSMLVQRQQPPGAEPPGGGRRSQRRKIYADEKITLVDRSIDYHGVQLTAKATLAYAFFWEFEMKVKKGCAFSWCKSWCCIPTGLGIAKNEMWYSHGMDATLSGSASFSGRTDM